MLQVMQGQDNASIEGNFITCTLVKSSHYIFFLLKINNIVGTVTTCHGSSKWSNTRLVFWGFDQENNSLNQLKYSNVICNKWVYGGSLTQR